MPLIYCICNKNKKISTHNQRVINRLQAHFGDQFVCYYSPAPIHALNFIHQLDASCTHLLCVGGDGTFNSLVNGVCTHPNTSFQPIVGVIPNGTGNDFYRSAGFDQKIDFVALVQQGRFISLDIGLIETENEKRYFANVADIGFGGAVVLELQKFRKNFGPNFSYGLAIIKTFFNYKKPYVIIESPAYSYSGALLLAAFCNGNIFADGLYIHPGAKINDGKLKLTLLGKVSLLDYLKNVLRVKRGEKVKHKEAFYLEVQTPLEIVCKETSLHGETDGEYLSGKHFKIDLFANKLKLLPLKTT